MSDVAWEAWELAVQLRDPTIITGDVLVMVQKELESLREPLRARVTEEKPERELPHARLGGDAWVCPRCGIVWAWWVPRCNCPPPTATRTTG